ncbi:MAG: hypothetical protein RL701_2459 [Pseudomonadota bacterium]|jgi:hypothetical protein
MQTIAWQQDGELTQTVPWFGSNESALRATIADLMQSPGVRSVSFQEPRNQLLVRFDRSVTNAEAIRTGSLGKPGRTGHQVGADAVRWAPTASKVLLALATALAR